MQPYTVAFRMELPHGHCVGVRLPERDPTLPEDARRLLHATELASASKFAPRRQISWFGGRVALHLALSDIGVTSAASLPNDRGAPTLPATVVGSISHKDGLAVALVSARGDWEIGVDVESVGPTKQDIAGHVLTDAERGPVDALAGDSRGREILLRFSAKEALYKALDPYVRRFVGFKEVEAERAVGDELAFRLFLGEREGPFDAEGRWLERDGFFLTTARVRPSSRA